MGQRTVRDCIVRAQLMQAQCLIKGLKRGGALRQGQAEEREHFEGGAGLAWLFRANCKQWQVFGQPRAKGSAADKRRVWALQGGAQTRSSI